MFDVLISSKTLFYIKGSYNVPVTNEIVPQSKICKTGMKQKFKCKFLLTLSSKLRAKEVHQKKLTKEVGFFWYGVIVASVTSLCYGHRSTSNKK